MQPTVTQRSPARNGQGDIDPLVHLPLALADGSGRKRHGRLLVLSRWPVVPGMERLGDGEEFRVVILAEPPDDAISLDAGLVVSVPARRLGSMATTARNANVAHQAGIDSDLAISPEDVEFLAQGSLFAATPLEVTPKEVFADGKAHLDLLARDLLLSTDVAEYLAHASAALYAPATPKPANLDRVEDLRQLLRVFASTSGDDVPEVEVGEALTRLSELASAANRERFLACARQFYPNQRLLMEDIYMLRAFVRSPGEARGLISMQSLLRQAAVPAGEVELTLDRSLALEQLNFVTLAVEPQRIPQAKAMASLFWRRYATRYREYHDRYWLEIARLHQRLLEQEAVVQALRRLNTLTELGPPVGAGALAAYEELVNQTASCPRAAGVGEIAETGAVCPECALCMDQAAPVHRGEEVMQHIEHACQRQLARLSSVAVKLVLDGRTTDGRVDQFLRIVQASQLFSLPEILDEELTRYLQRCLVEFKIQRALRPILDQLEDGAAPQVDKARNAMREVSQVLRRALRGSVMALPPGKTTRGTKEAGPEAPRCGRSGF